MDPPSSICECVNYGKSLNVVNVFACQFLVDFSKWNVTSHQISKICHQLKTE